MPYPFQPVRFRSPAGLVVEMRLATEQVRRMPFQRVDGDFWITGVEIGRNGIQLFDTHHSMLIIPEGWQSLVSSLPENWTLVDGEAIAFYRTFEERIVMRDVLIAIRRLLNGTESIDNLKLQHPELLMHAIMRRFLAELGGTVALPPRKRGAPRGARPTLRVLELYFHVKLLQLDGRSATEAIRIALDAPGAELPRKWKKDPRESLRKAVTALDEEGWFRTKPYS